MTLRALVFPFAQPGDPARTTRPAARCHSVRRGTLVVAGAALACSAGLAGCGGAKTAATPAAPASASAIPAAAGGEAITVHGDDQLMFAPMSIQAKVGVLHVTFINDGSIAHTFRVKGVEPDTGNVNGHHTAKIDIMLSHPGTYYIQCDYHPTMVGTLSVTS